MPPRAPRLRSGSCPPSPGLLPWRGRGPHERDELFLRLDPERRLPLLPLDEPRLEDPRFLLDADWPRDPEDDALELPDDDAFEPPEDERLRPPEEERCLRDDFDFFSPSSITPRQDPLSSSSIST